MEEKLIPAIRDDFHSINNWLNKITTSAGMARYLLQEDELDAEKIKEKKARLIKMMDGMEENALQIGEALKKLRKDINLKG